MDINFIIDTLFITLFTIIIYLIGKEHGKSFVYNKYKKRIEEIEKILKEKLS